MASISDHTNAKSIASIKDKYKQINIDKQIESIMDLVSPDKVDTYEEWKQEWDSLWLNISHNCNLRCVYCYGIDGSYGTEKALMSRDEVKKAIDFWAEKIDKTSDKVCVTFFGGEPTMNKDVLIYAVNYINSLFRDHVVIDYRITTNGTRMDETLIRFFKKNKFSVTISIDGNENQHNANRPYKGGKGSFRDAINSILQLQKSGVDTTSARLTIVHESVKSLEKNIRELWNLGVKNVAVNMVASEDDKYKITSNDINLIRKQMHNLAVEMLNNSNHNIYNFQLIAKLLHYRLTNNCLFYSNKNLLVETNGDVYMCHRFVGIDKFRIGNIYTNKIIRKTYDPENARKKCRSCWAYKLCTSCPQINYLYNNDVDLPYEIYCDFNKILIEEGIKLYTTIRCKK